MKRAHGWQVADAGPPSAGKTDSAELATNIIRVNIPGISDVGGWLR
jgi:hypothetical protein